VIHPVLPFLAGLALFVLVWRRTPARWRPPLLLIGSLANLALADPDYAAGLIPALLGFWALSQWMEREEGPRRRRVLLLAVALVLATLAFFKYTQTIHAVSNFILVRCGREARFSLKHWAMPLGMSYFSFRLLHYLIERHRNRVPRLGPMEFLNYLLFFPTFAAGPIERADRFRPDPAGDEPGAFKEGLRRIVFGLFKSLALAATLKHYAFPALEHPAQSAWWQAWLATYGLAFYIYYDFAGYSDIAIGMSRLLGYRIQENFNRPYLSASPAEFWRRWHMSLSYWLRDYVYIPLGGSRVPHYRHFLNYLAVMTVCGMWHGSAVHFVWWGAYHGVGLMVTDLVRRLVGPAGAGPGARAVALRGLGVAATFTFVAVGWLFFFFDFGPAVSILMRMAGREAPG